MLIKELIKLVESKSVQLDPLDIFLYQVNDHDQSTINSYVDKLKSGKHVDDIEVVPITDKFKDDVKKAISKFSDDDDRLEIKMFRELVKTNKPYLVIDGHHRVLAARIAKTKINASVDKHFPASELGMDYL